MYLLFPQKRTFKAKKEGSFRAPRLGGHLAEARILGQQTCAVGWRPHHQVYPEKILEKQLKHYFN